MSDSCSDVARRRCERAPTCLWNWPATWRPVLTYDSPGLVDGYDPSTVNSTLTFRWLGSKKRLLWTGDVDDTGPYLAAADVVVMTSRHDPQPLVPLEAAMVGTPTAALERDGLTQLGAGAALTAEYPDASALAAHVTTLLDDQTGAATVVAKAENGSKPFRRPR